MKRPATITPRGMMRWPAWMLLPVVLASMVGCKPKPPARVIQPLTTQEKVEDVDVIVDRYNANAERMPNDVILKCGFVDIQAGIVDEEGKTTEYTGGGRLYFVKPRYFYLTFGHMASTIAKMSSDGETYWLWYKETKKVYWGKYEHLNKPRLRDMPIQPDQVIAALGLTRLPKSFDRLFGPVFSVPTQPIPHTLNPQYKLTYFRRIEDHGRLDRVYSISRRPPYLAERILFGDKHGHVGCEATLDAFRPVGVSGNVIEGPGPIMPHKIALRLPQEDGYLILELDRPQLSKIPEKLTPPNWYKRPYVDQKPPPDWTIIQIDEEYDK